MKLDEILSELLETPSDQLNDNLRLTDIEVWDSMTHMLLITRLEEEFDIDFDQEDIIEMQSIGKIREKIAEKAE